MNQTSVKLGLRENWKQFTLLVIINGFVGGMVGLERSILPKIAEVDFEMVARTAILSFIIVFGTSKAIMNYFTGALANRFGRKRLLVIGWCFALPVPLILMYADSWSWIVFANILLGINQGLTWSSTVVMKIDLVGQKDRGLAMGINESIGYLSVGGVALLTGYVASQYGLRPYPFYIGVLFAGLGLLLSIFLVKDTISHVQLEESKSTIEPLNNVFWETTWKDRNLGSITQAGLINNMNDGMVWGIFPILLASLGFSLSQIAWVVAIYPMVWGVSQLVTGKMSDHLSKKKMLFVGMFAQGVALLLMVKTTSFSTFMVLSIVLGLGTALVYPTFLAGIGDYSNPKQRAKVIGIFRLWRDLGYAIGALITGWIADVFGIVYALLAISLLTILSSIIILVRMK